MSRNVNREVEAMRWRLIAFVFFTVTVVALLTVGVVLQRQRHQRLGERRVELEAEASRLRAQVNQLNEVKSRLTSVEALRQQMVRFNLGLTNANVNQRLFVERPVRLPKPPAGGSRTLPWTPSPLTPLATAGH
jgi:uncharacterized protein YlxW (UPF0749 family)